MPIQPIRVPNEHELRRGEGEVKEERGGGEDRLMTHEGELNSTLK